MHRLLFVALAVAVAVGVGVCRWAETPVQAQDRRLELVGTWEGAIEVSGVSLEVRMEFVAEPDDYVVGTIDIPAHGAEGLRLRSSRIEGTHLRLVLPLGTADVIFDGTCDGVRMSGTFMQGQATGTFALDRVDQEPTGQDRTLELVGRWKGSIDLAGNSLEIRLEFFSEPPEYVWGTIDIPAQSATAMRVRSVHVEGTHVRFELPLGTANAVFDGVYEGDRITGVIVQGQATGRFTLERTVEAPPEPGPSVRYAEIPLSVSNGDVVLGGTLTVPDGDGPSPAVVLITGSGAQNRDEEVFGFKVFEVLADHLTRAGIAVLRYDDRGVGESTGSIADATTEDFAGDALAFVAALGARPEIDGDRIGLLGHSEGAVAAAIAAARDPELAFVVMLAGTGVRGDQVLRRQAEDGARALGADDAAVARITAAHRRATEAVMTGAPREALTAAVRDLILAQLAGLPAAQQEAIGDHEAFAEPRIAPVVASMETPWMKFLLAFDPATALADVTCPVFAVFGELDTQVPPALNRAPIEAALSDNPRATVKVYPGANHLFQQARTGQVAEYAALDKAFIDGLLEDLSEWILEATAR